MWLERADLLQRLTYSPLQLYWYMRISALVMLEPLIFLVKWRVLQVWVAWHLGGVPLLDLVVQSLLLFKAVLDKMPSLTIGQVVHCSLAALSKMVIIVISTWRVGSIVVCFLWTLWFSSNWFLFGFSLLLFLYCGCDDWIGRCFDSLAHGDYWDPSFELLAITIMLLPISFFLMSLMELSMFPFHLGQAVLRP